MYQRLDGLCQNWQSEYKEAVTSEECEEIRQFYKPYLEKYESKYRILYRMLQQPNKELTSLLPTKEPCLLLWEVLKKLGKGHSKYLMIREALPQMLYPQL